MALATEPKDDGYSPPNPPCPPNPHPFELECVIVCDGYDDFLRNTLPENKFHFDKLVVVTSYEDKQTRRVCEHYHVECIPTDVLDTRKGIFCKGKGINVGLAALGKKDWVLHLDADIWLPPQTRSLIKEAKLNKDGLYGIDRFQVRGYDAWEKWRNTPIIPLQHEDLTWVHLNSFPLGTRVVTTDGYLPIGFFQMWNPSHSGVHVYPDAHTTAGRGDFNFATQWLRSKRGFLPVLVGYHLESKDAVGGINWEGRKSARFEPGS